MMHARLYEPWLVTIYDNNAAIVSNCDTGVYFHSWKKWPYPIQFDLLRGGKEFNHTLLKIKMYFPPKKMLK